MIPEHFGLKHPSVWYNLRKKWIKICYCNSIINDSPIINFSSLVEAKPLIILAIKFRISLLPYPATVTTIIMDTI
jgi:hypothetical protein